MAEEQRVRTDIIGLRADTWQYTVKIGDTALGVFDAKEGGDVDSDDTIYKPGAMADAYSLGGTRNIENLTLRRNYRLMRDHPITQMLIDKVGKGSVTVVGIPLDHDGNAHPGLNPITYQGKLKRVSLPDHDSTSGDAAMLEIEVTVSQAPTAG